MRRSWPPRRPVLQRGRGDEAPGAPVAVVLASGGGAPISAAAVSRAAGLAGEGSVAVVTVARLHGSAFGLQNPGLMPTRGEREEQRRIVAAAIDALDGAGTLADGQVVVTRDPAKVIARIATRRGAAYVVMDPAPAGWLQRVLHGDHPRSVRRRLRGVPVVVVGEVSASDPR